jgi:hypothetical protein
MTRMPPLSRRDWFRVASAGALGASLSGWFEALAHSAANNPQRRRACILLWMDGGPSQLETFDVKPGHANGGPSRDIATSVAGIRISEYLPQVARHMNRMALLRSMSTREADHGRGTFLMHTGHAPGTPISYPAMGALFAKELEVPGLDLPPFVSIAPNRVVADAAHQPGFLGPQYAPLILAPNGRVDAAPARGPAPPRGRQNRGRPVPAGGGPAGSSPGGPGEAYLNQLRIEDYQRPAGVSGERAEARVQLLQETDAAFVRDRPAASAQSHQAAYGRALRLMSSAAASAFNLGQEPADLRDRYGRNLFGQGCLLARRLVERGVPFVEVTLAGVVQASWDTHRDNFNQVRQLNEVLDPAWATLMSDLQDKGLLDTTLIVWAGEFGRTPRINTTNGRDHWTRSWSTVLAGGGIRGGQVIGRTSADGTDVTERPVSSQDFLATIGRALGIDVTRQNASNVGRPIRITEPSARPIQEVLS